jgi:MFS family permease
LWSGTFFSTAAQWIQQATLGWVAYQITGSAALLGAVLGIRAIPMLLLAPVSGVVAERFDRRRALAVSQLAPALSSFSLAALLAINAVQIWHLFAFALVSSLGMVFERTLRNTLVFDIVPRPEAPTAIALNTVAFSVTRALGPAIAGVLIAAIGPAWNFVIQGMMYAGVTASVLMIRARARRELRESPRRWSSMFAGLKFAATNPVARVLVIVGLIAPFLLIPSLSALMPVFASDVFRTGPEGLGLMLSAVGIGGVIGGLIATTLSRFDRVASLQSVSVLVFTISLIGMALSDSLAAAILCLTIAGIAEMTLASSTHTALQMSAPESMRGQVTSLIPMFPAFIALGSLTSGIGTEFMGPRATVIVTALLGLVVIGLCWTQSQAFRRLRLSKLVARE